MQLFCSKSTEETDKIFANNNEVWSSHSWINIMVLQAMIPCCLVDGHQHFCQISRHNLQGRRDKHWKSRQLVQTYKTTRCHIPDKYNLVTGNCLLKQKVIWIKGAKQAAKWSFIWCTFRRYSFHIPAGNQISWENLDFPQSLSIILFCKFSNDSFLPHP